MGGELKPEEHLRLLFWMARRLANRHRKDPCELVSHGWLGLCKAASTYNPDRGASPATWAGRWIVHFICRGERDHGNRRPLFGPKAKPWRPHLASRPRPNAVDGVDLALDARVDHVAAVISADGSMSIRRAVRLIPDRRQRVCVYLRYLRGWNDERICKVIGRKRDRVRLAIVAGLKCLREQLREEDFF